MRFSSFVLVVLAFGVCGVNVGVTALADDAWSYNPETGVLKATYTTTGAPLQTTPC